MEYKILPDVWCFVMCSLASDKDRSFQTLQPESTIFDLIWLLCLPVVITEQCFTSYTPYKETLSQELYGGESMENYSSK